MIQELDDRSAKSKKEQSRKRLSTIGQFVLPFVVIAVLWEISARFGYINVQVLPAPSMIYDEFYDLIFVKKTLQQHLGHSLYRLFIGYILAVIIGVAIGMILGLNRIIREMFSPILSLLISVPTIAWIPVLLITMGLGDKTVITAIFLGGVFEITYSTIAGIRSSNRQQLNAARIMGVKGLGLFVKVLLPASLVYIMPSLRLSIGYCWRALIGGEMLSAMIIWGIGKMIYEARFWNDIKVMFVGLLIIGLLGVVLDRMLLKRLERETIEKWGMMVVM